MGKPFEKGNTVGRLFHAGNTLSRRHGATKMLPDGRVLKSPTYQSWASMNDRCYNDRHKWWNAYGGRGIVVCERWRRGRTNPSAFSNFVEDVGERPSKELTLDRVDVNGPYAPMYNGKKQCRWATKSEQRINQRGAADAEPPEERDAGSGGEVPEPIPY